MKHDRIQDPKHEWLRCHAKTEKHAKRIHRHKQDQGSLLLSVFLTLTSRPHPFLSRIRECHPLDN